MNKFVIFSGATDVDLCVDATHPYAAQVSQHIRSACEQARIPLLRLLREESEVPVGTGTFSAAAEAALVLIRRP